MEGLAEKKKIFISAHPNDRYLYLDRIVGAINGIEGFEALYNPIPNDRGPSIPDNVDTVVIVASLKYFVWTNSGYISEYFAAVRNGANVIPILIESTQNVIDLINMRCGKLQYIDATENLDFALDTLRAYLTVDQRHVDDSLPSFSTGVE